MIEPFLTVIGVATVNIKISAVSFLMKPNIGAVIHSSEYI